jgi:regulatory protein
MQRSRFGPKAGKRADADGSNRAPLESTAGEAEVSADADRNQRLARARAVLSEAAERPKSASSYASSASDVSSAADDAQPLDSEVRASGNRASKVRGARASASKVRGSQARRATPAEVSPAGPQAFSDPFEDADPFESFEQCAVHGISGTESASPDAAEPVYTRSSQRTRKSSAAELNSSKRPQRSLKGRALGYLSRREYSRAELSRKLKPYIEESDSLDALLDDLEREGWLSNERFVESVVHRRAGRMGGGRIIHELKRHAVGETLISETAGKLAQTEIARAQSVWEKKFGAVPETPAERAKQARFLASRGFSGSVIGKILKGADEDFTDEPIDD